MTSSTRPGSPVAARNDEELNLEYIRNVILQFLEHKEMRVRVTLLVELVVFSSNKLLAQSRSRIVHYSPFYSTRNQTVNSQSVALLP